MSGFFVSERTRKAVRNFMNIIDVNNDKKYCQQNIILQKLLSQNKFNATTVYMLYELLNSKRRL